MDDQVLKKGQNEVLDPQKGENDMLPQVENNQPRQNGHITLPTLMRFSEVCERFNELQTKCPHHNFDEYFLLETF